MNSTLFLSLNVLFCLHMFDMCSFELLVYPKLNWFAVKCCMACVITISYQLAAHLPIYYFYNLRVSLTINAIHLCVVCGQVFPLPFLPSSRIRSRFLSSLRCLFLCSCVFDGGLFMWMPGKDGAHSWRLCVRVWFGAHSDSAAWATFLFAVRQPWVSYTLCLSPDGWWLEGIMGMCFYSFWFLLSWWFLFESHDWICSFV